MEVALRRPGFLGQHAALALAVFWLGPSVCLWAQDARPKVENPAIAVSLDPADGALDVLDKRTGQHWRQKPLAQGKITSATTTRRGIAATWHDTAANLDVDLVIQASENEPEFTVALAARWDALCAILIRSPRKPAPTWSFR